MERVYPWCPEKFKGSIEKKRAINEYFKKLQYPMETLAKAPSDRTLKAVDSVLDLLFKNKWVFAASSSSRLLQALALICPVTHTFTLQKASRNVTTGDLIHLLLRDVSGFENEAMYVNEWDRIRRAGLLVWVDIPGRVPGSDKFSGRFASLLNNRILQKKPVLATAAYRGRLPKDGVNYLMTHVEAAIGGGAASAIQEMCVFKDFVVGDDEASFGREVI
uniref:Uncharacterized protein n=1 Tax=viral metagenome TaxID=1070528 RepID=A0A6M3MA98_9ZZZZ